MTLATSITNSLSLNLKGNFTYIYYKRHEDFWGDKQAGEFDERGKVVLSW